MSKEALQRAVEIVEGQAGLAERLSAILHRRITQQHVWNWLNRDSRIPAEYCRAIEEATEGRVTAGDLRPDLWPPRGDDSNGRPHV